MLIEDAPAAAPGEKGAAFSAALLTWYAGAQRDLPWRRTRDPYAVWISETMLQQTQVATVIPYWEAWMARFPTAAALAAAPLDEVLRAWQGLGYYARARNLHRAAQAVTERHGGRFPERFEDVLALPGVGRYTAGAVCSIALGQDAPIVDANVIRVLCRVFGLRGEPKSPKVQERLWDLAAGLIPPGQARDFNQAMMELGALVCQAKPRCDACPVRDLCAAYATGDPASLPEFAPKKAFTSQTDVSAVVGHPDGDGRLLLAQRPKDGLWGGLWEMPRVTAAPGESPGAAAERAARTVAGLDVDAEAGGEPAATVRHGVTTRKITLLAVPCSLCDPAAEPRPVAGAADDVAWAFPEEMGERYPLSSPQRRLVARLAERGRERERQLSLF